MHDALAAAARVASDFERSMEEVRCLTDLSADEIEHYRQKAVELGRAGRKETKNREGEEHE